MKEYWPLGVVLVDLAKPLETESHSYIITALEQKSVIIITLYEDIWEHQYYIDLKNEQPDALGIWIGTKQGDQMSPILFNSSMDAVTALLGWGRMWISILLEK